jgi:pimeloyl-ACP methyl ester carboxylesterase
VNPLQLHHGPLRFSALEQGTGPLVLCLHGFPDHARSYRFQLPALADAGFHAIAPTMRGYEPSSQPSDGDYHVLRMAEDVVAWLDQLGAERCHLVGHDWGAVIGYVAAALAPERFHSLTTLAIAHPGRIERELLKSRPSQLLKSWYMLFFQLPGIAEAALEARGFALLHKLWRDWAPGFVLPPEERRLLEQTFLHPGVKRAALSYYRALFAVTSPDARKMRKLLRAPLQVPTLALTGALDGCMDSRLHDDLMHSADFAAGLQVERLARAGHFLHQEQPEQVNAFILSWLRRWTQKR